MHRPGCVKMRDNLACRSEKLVPVDVNLGIGYSFWDSVDDTTVYTGLSRFALSRSFGALPITMIGKSTKLRTRRFGFTCKARLIPCVVLSVGVPCPCDLRLVKTELRIIFPRLTPDYSDSRSMLGMVAAIIDLTINPIS